MNFHPQPGPRERQLQRKVGNPLFPISNTIAQSDIENARALDQSEMESFLVEFRQLVEQVAALDGQADADDILKIKAQLEQFYPRACGIPGDVTVFKDALNKLIEAITQALVKAAAGDPESMSKIDEDRENSELHLRISEYPLVSDLLSSEDIIPSKELTPTLLGADQDSLAAAMLLFGPEQLADIIREADALILSHADLVQAKPEILMRLEQLRQWHTTIGK